MDTNMSHDLKEEYKAILDSAGLLELAEYSILSVTGKDRARFLHGILSNDIKGLQEGQGCVSAMLNVQGRTLALMEVLNLGNSFLLLLWPGLLDKVQGHLRKYIISDHIELIPLDREQVLFTLQGPRALDRIKAVFNLSEFSRPFDHCLVNRGALTVRMVVSDRSGLGGVDIIVPAPELDEFEGFLSRSFGEKISKVSLAALNLHRIEAGIPWYGVDLNETQLPLEAGLKIAISYTKGCYLGQEIIARATYRGHLNRKLGGIILEGVDPVHEGSLLFYGDKEVGFVTSSVNSPAIQSGIALAYLRQEVWDSGTKLMIKDGNISRMAKVVELPFVSHAPSNSPST